MREEDRYVLATYEKFPFALERGEGCYVWDEAGTKYLDFYGGHAVALLGHCPEAVAAAVSQQSRKLMFYSNLVYHNSRLSAARALVEFCGEAGSQVFFCNSGAEANENAMRLARSVTGRNRIVATEGSFHGRTAGALAATGLAKYRKGVSGLGTDVSFCAFGDLSSAREAIGPNVAGLILEPIQSMAGIVEPPAGYLQGLEKICRERGALLIFDEVQTGLGRLGAPSAARAFGVRPHLMSFAKGLGSGVPVGAVLADAETSAKVKGGSLGSTFGGGPLACVAVEATLREIQRLDLCRNASLREKEIREALRLPGIASIRGKGLLLGIVLEGPSKLVRQKLLEKKILVGGAEDPNVVRLLPPLMIGRTEVEALRDALSEILSGGLAAVR